MASDAAPRLHSTISRWSANNNKNKNKNLNKNNNNNNNHNLIVYALIEDETQIQIMPPCCS